MTTRGRVLLILAVAVLTLAGAVWYFLDQRASATRETSGAAGVPVTADVETLLAGDHVVVRTTALGSGYGKLSVVDLADPTGPRAILDPVCERVYAGPVDGVCITAERGVVSRYGVQMLDAQMRPTVSSDLVGLPSRARISRDGALVATTTFVTGHSYAGSNFSTETTIRTADGEILDNIENFRATVDGEPLIAVDRNFWGVTFAADGNTFWATGASGGKTWLMRGDLAARTLTSVREDAECPSLSPDGTKLAYKTRLGNPTPGDWRIAVLDLATGEQTVLAGDRSVDDQVEWLDDTTLLYALPREGAEATTTDIWRVPADGTGSPEIFIPAASSPAVVRM